MKKKNLLLLIVITLFITSLFAQNDSIGIYPIYVNNDEYYLLSGPDTLSYDTVHLFKYTITVNFYDTITPPQKGSFEQSYGLINGAETAGRYVNYGISNPDNYITICDAMYNDPYVEEFVFDVVMKYCGTEPDDPGASSQWYLDIMDVKEAWGLTMGSKNVTVAVIDNGLWFDLEDIGSCTTNAIQNVFRNQIDPWSQECNPSSGDLADQDPP